MFKVEYSRLALMPDGSAGNVKQGNDIAYTETDLVSIPVELGKYLKSKGNKYTFIINKITLINGHLVKL